MIGLPAQIDPTVPYFADKAPAGRHPLGVPPTRPYRAILSQAPPDGILSPCDLRYDPLDHQLHEIRLLNILPGEVGSTIRCTLSHVSFDTAPGFTALSYCWGDLEDGHSVLVNGCQVKVTANLKTAIWELRRRKETVIWVDALCINQKDDSERGHQVALMGQIYSQSTKTISWLGQDDEKIAVRVFEFMRLLATRRPLTDFEKAMKAIRRGNGKQQLPSTWLAFVTFYKLPYWRRTWIIQELALSSNCTIAWGPYSLPLETLLQSIRHTSFLPNLTAGGALVKNWNLVTLDPEFDNIRSFARIMGDASTKVQPANYLAYALAYTRSAQASDPKDKIYGILALCKDGPTLVQSPNYGKSLSGVILEVATNMLLGDTPLEIICLKNPFRENKDGLPSWVPDWRQSWDSRGEAAWISLKNRRLTNYYNATQKSKRTVDVVGGGRILKIRGTIFDRVVSSIDIFSDTNDKGAQHNPVLSAQKSAYGYKTYNAIWRTLVMDTRSGLETEPDGTPAAGKHFSALWSEEGLSSFDSRGTEFYQKAFRRLQHVTVFDKSIGNWAEAGSSLVDQLPVTETKTTSTKSQRNLERLIQALKLPDLFERRIIITKKGYIGLGHAKCQVGDKICLFGGCSVPVLLREFVGNYIMVGEAYVHGIMDGGSWDESSDQQTDFLIY